MSIFRFCSVVVCAHDMPCSFEVASKLGDDDGHYEKGFGGDFFLPSARGASEDYGSQARQALKRVEKKADSRLLARSKLAEAAAGVRWCAQK